MNTGIEKYLDQNEKMIKKTIGICLAIFVVISLLYYYLRFQFDLVNIIPLLQYGLAYGIIVCAFYKVLIQKNKIIYTRVDLWVFLFLSYNLLFVPFSFFRYGLVEGLYAIKNYLTGLFLYFAVILFFDGKMSRNIFKITMIICTVVSIIYMSELISVRYGEETEDGVILSGELFKYTVRLNRYAMEIEPSGHGVSKSWRKSSLSTFVRLPGPLGHSNATTFVIGLGCIISFALLVFKHLHKSVIPFFLIGLVTLFWGCTRTNIVSALAGILFLSVFGLINKRIKLYQLLITFISGLVLIVVFISLRIIDWEAYSQIFNLEQTLFTLSVILSKANFDKLFDQIAGNSLYFILGYGLAPVLGSTYRSADYSGLPIVSNDAFFIQFFSQYGILLSLFIFLFLVHSLWDSYRRCKQANPIYFENNLFIIAGILAVLISGFLSSLHGAAPFRPQINPVVYILLGTYSVIIREGIHAKGRNDLFVAQRFPAWIKKFKTILCLTKSRLINIFRIISVFVNNSGIN